MKTSDFSYSFPPSLIAAAPAEKRTDSKVLMSEIRENKRIYEILNFSDIVNVIRQSKAKIFDLKSDNILFIGNDSAVFSARFFAKRSTGGIVEVFLTEYPRENKDNLENKVRSKLTASCLLQPQRRLKVGEKLLVLDKKKKEIFDSNVYFEIESLESCRVICPENFETVCTACGFVPMPPYIEAKRQLLSEQERNNLSALDSDRYHTVYEKNVGSVAAPTAGLHFSKEFMQECLKSGCEFEFVQLHVGLGTFLPVKSDMASEHNMHFEECLLTNEFLRKLRSAVEFKTRIVLIGTTTLRCLESFARLVSSKKRIEEWSDCDWEKAFDLSNRSFSTNLFLLPSNETEDFVPCIGDCLFTNFHQPQSTLCMLVAKLISFKAWKEMYEFAVKSSLRLFSYGDGNLLMFGNLMQIAKAQESKN